MRVSRALLIVGFLIGLDQLTKQLVEAYLPLRESVGVLPFLSWFRTYNTGISFSFLNTLSPILLTLIVGMVAAFILIIWIKTPSERSIAHLGFAFIVSGAIGNLVDRALFGHVIDFIQFHVASWSFAIFNLADSYITIGAILVIFDEVTHARQAKVKSER